MNILLVGALLFFIIQSVVAIPPPESIDTRQLELVLMLIRHGARSATFPLPDDVDPIDWPEGPRTEGMLMPEGEQQHFELGGRLRSWLIDKEEFLNSDYLDFRQVAVRSSGFDRTVQSAQSLLLGLYPDPPAEHAICGKTDPTSCYQPVAIQSVHKHRDPLLIPWESCNVVQDYWKYEVPYLSEAQEMQANDQQFFNRMASILGFEYLNATNLEAAYDPLRCDHWYGVLPDGVSEEDWQKIRDDYYLMKKLCFTTDSTITRLISSEILREWADRIQEVIDGSRFRTVDRPLFRLYSGHDYGIMAVLSAFGIFDGTIPEFASHFEIHVRSTPDKVIAALSLNDEPIILPSNTACAQSVVSKDVDGLVWCDADALVTDLIERTLSSNVDWDNTCDNVLDPGYIKHLEYQSTINRTSLDTGEIILIVFVCIAVVALIVLLVLLFGPRMKQKKGTGKQAGLTGGSHNVSVSGISENENNALLDAEEVVPLDKKSQKSTGSKKTEKDEVNGESQISANLHSDDSAESH